MRKIFIAAAFVVLGVGGFIFWYQKEGSPLTSKNSKNGIPTLEIRFTMDQVLQNASKDLIKTKNHILLDPSLAYVPYLWMDVKFADKERGMTRESTLLWDLEDGEMVLNTANWEKSHGYEECLEAQVESSDFTLINAIAGGGGMLTRQELASHTGMEEKNLLKALERCVKKRLILEREGTLRLHLANPRLAKYPSTEMHEEFMASPSNQAQKMQKRFSAKQIETFVAKAFGEDFFIRHSKEVFIPVYTISIQNPDGSIFTTRWNALSGERIR